MTVATARLGPVAVMPIAATVAAGWLALVLLPSAHGPGVFAAMWLAMTVAMMLPTAARPMQRAADGSPARAWAFIAGYSAAWLAAGVPAYAVLQLVDWTPAWIAFAWILAGAYQLTPLMQRMVRDCRSVLFDGRPFGYGARQGGRCLASCGPLMLAVMVTSMALPSPVPALLLLAGATGVICWQKRPATGAQAVATVGLVVVLGAVGAFVLAAGQPAGSHHADGSSMS